MNPSHYPSLELCKKLTEIGFPPTRDRYETDGKIVLGQSSSQFMGVGQYVCPSVMEMLDVMPKEINGLSLKIKYMKLKKAKIYGTYGEYGSVRDGEIPSFNSDTLPNLLANMIIWLFEKEYISDIRQ